MTPSTHAISRSAHAALIRYVTTRYVVLRYGNNVSIVKHGLTLLALKMIHITFAIIANLNRNTDLFKDDFVFA